MLVWNIDKADRVYTGEDKVLFATIYQTNGRTIQPLTNWTMSWMLKRSLTDDDGEALVTATTSSTITITDAAAGECQIAIRSLDTIDLEPGTYVHELIRTNSGERTVLAQGDFVLQRGVHRS